MAVFLPSVYSCCVQWVNYLLQMKPILTQCFVCLWFHSFKEGEKPKNNIQIIESGRWIAHFRFLSSSVWHLRYIRIRIWMKLAHLTYVELALANKCGGRLWLGEFWWWSGAVAVVALSTLMLIFCMPLNLLSLLVVCPSPSSSCFLLSIDFTWVLLIFLALLLSHWCAAIKRRPHPNKIWKWNSNINLLKLFYSNRAVKTWQQTKYIKLFLCLGFIHRMSGFVIYP